MKKLPLFVILAALIGGAIVASRSEPGTVNLDSALTLWSDGLRDADQAGMHLTRMSDADEVQIGEKMAASILTSSKEDAVASAYISKVGALLVPGIHRKGIAYHFYALHSPDVNAFALPGGYIFVYRGLLDFAQSEAELASVLGHEISHVDLRHCVEKYQYAVHLSKNGMPELGELVEFGHRLATMSFSPAQELDADAQGERLAVQAGYDPGAGAGMFTRMQQYFREPVYAAAHTPEGEATQALSRALGAYFRSHPASEERVRKLQEIQNRNDSILRGRYYTGKRNLHERKCRSEANYPDETVELR